MVGRLITNENNWKASSSREGNLGDSTKGHERSRAERNQPFAGNFVNSAIHKERTRNIPIPAPRSGTRVSGQSSAPTRSSVRARYNFVHRTSSNWSNRNFATARNLIACITPPIDVSHRTSTWNRRYTLNNSPNLLNPYSSFHRENSRRDPVESFPIRQRVMQITFR